MSKQRVSPFFRDLHLLLKFSSCFHERNVYRFPENGTLPLSKQRVSLFYHDLDLGLVGLIGNFLLVEQLLLLVVELLLNPNLSSSHVSRKSWRNLRRRIYLLVYDFSSFHPNNFLDTISWECFVKNGSVRSCLIELHSFLQSKIDVDPIHVFWCYFHALCMCCARRGASKSIVSGSLCSLSCEGDGDVVGSLLPFAEVRRFCMAIRLSSSGEGGKRRGW